MEHRLGTYRPSRHAAFAQVLGFEGGVSSRHDHRTAVRTCLSGERFTRAVARFQAAAEREVHDEVRFLVRARLDRTPRAVLAAREERDRTAWGMINALTALARNAGDLRERTRLETQADNILQSAGIPCPLARSTRERRYLLC